LRLRTESADPVNRVNYPNRKPGAVHNEMLHFVANMPEHEVKALERALLLS